MNQKILFLFTRTPLHVGAGSSVGAIDQPVQRERHTGYPIIPGSSIKGVLRDTAMRDSEMSAQVDDLFGTQDSAGKLAFGEARLLAFPLRSAKGSYALATSTTALRRFARDAGLEIPVPDSPKDLECLAGEQIKMGDAIVIEEYKLKVDGAFPETWAKHLSGCLNDAVLNGAKQRFVLLSDGDFSHFVKNCCQVDQHIAIDPETGTVKGHHLFNEETIPSETLFYSALSILPRGVEDNIVLSKLAKEWLLQFGGGSTTGLGFCTVKLA